LLVVDRTPSRYVEDARDDADMMSRNMTLAYVTTLVNMDMFFVMMELHDFTFLKYILKFKY